MPVLQRVSSVSRSLVLCSLAAGSLLPALPALAQDSAFLACGRFEDRGQRIACLEDALEAALGAQAAAADSAPAAAASQAPVTSQAATGTAPAAPAPAAQPPAAQPPAAATVSSEERSLLDRIRNFGRSDAGISISTNESGQEQLNDTIAALEKRNNLWIITLSSGQVWRQTYARNLLLRKGDAISIYQEGIGNAYRLATPRLSGFIRVERVQ